MVKTLILAFIIALVLQIVMGLEQVSPATREKLRKAISDAVDTKRDGAKAIKVVTRAIEINIAPAVLPTEKNLYELGKSIEDAVKQAKADNVDISKCTDEVRSALAYFEKFDKDAVRACKLIPEVVKSDDELKCIEKEVRVLLNLEQTCSTNANQDKCVLDGIAVSSQKIVDLQKRLISIIKNAKPEEANVCIGATAEKLQYDVNKMIENWKICLKIRKFNVM